MSLALTNVLNDLSNFLKKEKPMLHSITGINISCLCIIVFVFVRLSRSNTDEEALMVIWVHSCSGNPLFLLSRINTANMGYIRVLISLVKVNRAEEGIGNPEYILLSC